MLNRQRPEPRHEVQSIPDLFSGTLLSTKRAPMHKSLFWGLLITSFMFSISMPAQSAEDWPRIKTVTELMDEASELYDAGDISGAIALYDEAWEGDTAYCRSLIGKSYLLSQLSKRFWTAVPLGRPAHGPLLPHGS